MKAVEGKKSKSSKIKNWKYEAEDEEEEGEQLNDQPSEMRFEGGN